MTARCDLHAHSRCSDRPSEWYLDRIGAPESFTEPFELYRVAKARGMDFVTITDHDSIAGALEIAELPDTFLSTEVSVSFPEDGCAVHCLVWGITERQHAETQRLRGDLYAFRKYLRAEGIAHAIAHPLFRVDDQLTVEHLEKLLVLFRRFETANGTREPRASRVVEAVLGSLTPDLLADLAERHRLEFDGDLAYSSTGGSDDHGGLYLATTWTETPAAVSPDEFVAHLASGRTAPAGEHGSALKLARSFQTLAHDYYRAKVLGGARRRGDPFSELLRRFASGDIDPDRPEGFRFRDLARRLSPIAAAPRRIDLPGARRHAAESALAREAERRVFDAASRLGDRSLARTLEASVSALERGDMLGAIGALPGGLGSAAVALSPYLAAFRFQHKDEFLVAAVATRFAAAKPHSRQRERVAWATDTLTDVNGVASTIQAVARLAGGRGLPLTVLSSTRLREPLSFENENFTPIWETPLPGYDELSISVPPALEMIEHCEREGYGQILISTPGPVGLVALAAAKLLERPAIGIHHTDFPRYATALGGGDRAAGWARAYLRWFYRQMDRVFVASRRYADELVDWGVEAERIETLEHGVDSGRFRPEMRQAGFFERFGLDRRFTFLCVGRVSREKNLEALLAAFRGLRGRGLDAQLAIVGDGPARGELEAAFAAPDVAFTGYLFGDDLAAAYASADTFVFPSRTDTFGNVTLEAMASALPVLVSHEGGPAETIRHGEDGLIVDLDRESSLAQAMELLAKNPALRARLGEAARRAAMSRRWDGLLSRLFPGATSAPARVEETAAVASPA